MSLRYFSDQCFTSFISIIISSSSKVLRYPW